MKQTTVLMVGVGGYGGTHLQALLHTDRVERFQIVGAVDPYAKKSKFYEELMNLGVPIFDTVEEFYEEHKADMAVIATPIHLHEAQAKACMEHGSDVLCEKPICASLEEAASMIEARDRTGRKLAIGFQWSFSEGIVDLKKDILNGIYGKIKRFRTIVYYPRDLAYYHRGSGWAGKRRLSSGEWLLDSVASNATAHFLHNMLFLTGSRIDRAAEPVSLLGEVYRANPIEMFDTCALKVLTESGAELCFYATHAVPKEQHRNPDFVMEGELGTVTLTYQEGKEVLEGHLKEGSVRTYGRPSQDTMRKLDCMREAICQDAPLTCVPETTLPHLKCICALAEAVPETPEFGPEYLRYNEETSQYTCEGLGEALDLCWREGRLPSELQLGWAQKPVFVDMRGAGK